MKVLTHHSVEYIDESARGWLYVTARNMSLNRIRKKSRTGKVTSELTQMQESDNNAMEEEKIQSDLLEKVQKRGQKLSEEQRSLLEMRLSGLSNREIAELKQVPEGTIKSRFHAIIQYLKKGFSQ